MAKQIIAVILLSFFSFSSLVYSSSPDTLDQSQLFNDLPQSFLDQSLTLSDSMRTYRTPSPPSSLPSLSAIFLADHRDKMLSFSEESPHASIIRSDPGYREKLLTIASFTGGGAKGLMEIYAVSIIEEALNHLPLPFKIAIIERRIKRFWDIYDKTKVSPEIVKQIEEKLKRHASSEEPYVYFQDVVDEFAGTSTGSIIASGLAYMEPLYMEAPELKDSADDILIPCKLDGGSPFKYAIKSKRLIGFKRYKAYEIGQIYYRHLIDIFNKASSGLISAKYPKDNLQALLKTFFEDITLDAAYPYKNILIPVTRESGEETMLSLATTIPYHVSYDHSRFWSNVSLATIIEASCSAPSFFDPVEIQGKTYSDGGTMLNAPIHHLMRFVHSKFPKKLVNAISFGAGALPISEPSNRTARLGKLGILSEYGKAGGVGVAINAALSNPRLSHMEAYNTLISEPETYYRLSHLNPNLINKEMKKMDSVDSKFVGNCLKQVNAQLHIIYQGIIPSLLEFLNPNDQLLPQTTLNHIPDITKDRLSSVDLPLSIDEHQESSASRSSEVYFVEASQKEFNEARLKWTRLHVSRLVETQEANDVLKSIILADPFKRMPDGMSCAERYNVLLKAIHNLGITSSPPPPEKEKLLNTNRIRRVILARAINTVKNEKFISLRAHLQVALEIPRLFTKELFQEIIESFKTDKDEEFRIVLCWIREVFPLTCPVPTMPLSKNKQAANAAKGVASAVCSFFMDTTPRAFTPSTVSRQKLAESIMEDREVIVIPDNFYARTEIMDHRPLIIAEWPNNHEVFMERSPSPESPSRSGSVSPSSQNVALAPLPEKP